VTAARLRESAGLAPGGGPHETPAATGHTSRQGQGFVVRRRDPESPGDHARRQDPSSPLHHARWPDQGRRVIRRAATAGGQGARARQTTCPGITPGPHSAGPGRAPPAPTDPGPDSMQGIPVEHVAFDTQDAAGPGFASKRSVVGAGSFRGVRRGGRARRWDACRPSPSGQPPEPPCYTPGLTAVTERSSVGGGRSERGTVRAARQTPARTSLASRAAGAR
jgi:hypothetical protein